MSGYRKAGSVTFVYPPDPRRNIRVQGVAVKKTQNSGRMFGGKIEETLVMETFTMVTGRPSNYPKASLARKVEDGFTASVWTSPREVDFSFVYKNYVYRITGVAITKHQGESGLSPTVEEVFTLKQPPVLSKVRLL